MMFPTTAASELDRNIYTDIEARGCLRSASSLSPIDRHTRLLIVGVDDRAFPVEAATE